MSKLNPYNVPNADVAKVLEDAADLYESEQIEWCTGKWADSRNGVISACAEGAILLARGYHWAEVFSSGGRLIRDDLLITAAYNSLLNHLNEGGDRKLPTIYYWNDRVAGDRRRVKFANGSTTLTEPNRPKAKAQVIEAMKATAKDLRNSEGNS